MQKLILAAFLALAPAIALGQSVDMPQTVQAAAGRLAAVEMVFDGDDFQYVVPPQLDAFREYTTDANLVKLRVIGYQNGTFPITAVATKVVDGKAKLSPFKSCLVHVGGTPPVPPGPNPPPEPPEPPEPPVPPTPAGSRTVMIFHETGQQTPAQGILFNELQSGASGTYLRSKGHKVHILDDDSVGSDGKPVLESWVKHLAGITLPAIVITDDKGNVVHKGPCPATTSDVLNAVKASGG